MRIPVTIAGFTVAIFCMAIPLQATVPLQDFITVNGAVTDQGGEPLPGALVVVSGKSSVVEVGEGGEFSFSLPPGHSTIIAWGEGFTLFREEVELSSGMGSMELTIQLQSSDATLGELSGVVECDKRQAPRKVELPQLGLVVHCDEEGGYSLLNVPAGSWRVVAHCENFTPQIIEEVVITGDETVVLNFNFFRY